MKKPVIYIALAMVLFVVITTISSAVSFIGKREKYESIPKEKILWNLREMKLAEGKPAQKTLDVYKKLVAISEDEMPKGIRIDWARANGNDILVVFERHRYLNSNLDRDYIAVFDTQGRYQYGFEGHLIIKGKNEIAFSLLEYLFFSFATRALNSSRCFRSDSTRSAAPISAKS